MTSSPGDSGDSRLPRQCPLGLSQQGCGGLPVHPTLPMPAPSALKSVCFGPLVLCPRSPPAVPTELSPGCPFPSPGGTWGHTGAFRGRGCAPATCSRVALSQVEGPSGRPGSTSTTPGGTGTTRAWRPFASTTAGACASGPWPSRPAPPSGSCPRTWVKSCTSAPRRAFGASTRSSRRARPAPTTTSASSARWVSARPQNPLAPLGGGRVRAHCPQLEMARDTTLGEITMELGTGLSHGGGFPRASPFTYRLCPPRAHLLVALVLLEPLLAERLRQQRHPDPPAPLRQRAGGGRAEGAQVQGQGGGAAGVQRWPLPR